MISPGFNNLSSLPQKDSLHLEGSNQDALFAMGQAPLSFLALLPRPPVQLLLWKGHLRTLHTTIFTLSKWFQMSGAHHSQTVDSPWSVFL